MEAEPGAQPSVAPTPGNATPVASTSTSHLLSPSQLLSLPVHQLDLSTVQSALEGLPIATRLVTCANLVLSCKFYDQITLRRVVELGLEAGEEETELLKDDVRSRLEEAPQGSDGWEGYSRADVSAQVKAVLGTEESRRAVVRCLAVLQQAKRRLDTYDIFYPPRALPAQANGKTVRAAEEDELDLDDPWADNDDDDDAPPLLDDPWTNQSDSSESGMGRIEATPEPESLTPPIDPAVFALQSLPLSAFSFAASANMSALRTICQRHSEALWPHRISIIETVPGWVSPADDNMLALLLSCDESGQEAPWPRKQETIKPAFLDYLIPEFGIPSMTASEADMLPAPRDRRLTGDQVSAWYSVRVLNLDDLGLLDAQLAWVQHAASLGVLGLDAIGEDLSLLSRLIYDANLTPYQQEAWSLGAWRLAEPADIVRAYLFNSTPSSIVGDIRRLVLPYLYVLESRAERAGKADPQLVERMLHGAILDLSLALAFPCFEASKATLRSQQRLIKDDMTVARLALACLYGSDQREAWSSMSAIFECLPVWDTTGSDPEDDREAISTTLDSIAAFVRPTTSSSGQHSPRDLFMFFLPLPFASLSRALDILDVHLESGEILARWDVPVYLRTLLQSARDHDEQVTLAEKMVRRNGTRGVDERAWMLLWDDMVKLQGGQDALLRGAFGMLGREEMMKIYLGGLLSAGNLPVARKVIRRLEPEGYFSPHTLEEVALQTSNELYMRAESGNINTGDMKLAYEVLSIPPESDAIRVEQDFIQATSRLTTFKSLSTLSPAEIRHVRNKLDLIRRVLSTSDDAYKHTAIVLELTDKLGFKGDEAARAEVLAMLCDAAVANEDWTVARERVDEMVGLAEPDLGTEETTTARAQRLRGVVWRSCLALGRQSEYPDLAGRMALLAHAVTLCPAEEVPHLMPLYRSVEDKIAAHPEALAYHAPKDEAAAQAAHTGFALPSLPGGFGIPGAALAVHGADGQDRVLGSRRAARAAKLALDGISAGGWNLRSFTSSPAAPGSSSARSERSVDSNQLRDAQAYPQRTATPRGDRPRSSLDRPRGSTESDRRHVAHLFGGGEEAGSGDEGVSGIARRGLVKGVGWLLGADEGDYMEK